MADIQLAVQSTPTTPSAGNAVAYVDTTSKELAVKDANGFIHGRVSNFSTAAQVLAATTLTYITGSNLAIPTGKLQIGTCFRWAFNITKTAAGVASSTYAIVVGTAGTTADTARVSFTKPAGTAVIDEGRIEVAAICRGPLTASGVMVGEFILSHTLQTTGHYTLPSLVLNTVSSAFDVTTANLIVGLVVTTGAADAITIQMVQAEAWNL